MYNSAKSSDVMPTSLAFAGVDERTLKGRLALLAALVKKVKAPLPNDLANSVGSKRFPPKPFTVSPFIKRSYVGVFEYFSVILSKDLIPLVACLGLWIISLPGVPTAKLYEGIENVPLGVAKVIPFP